MPTVPNTYTQTDPTEIRDRALRGFSRAAEARAIRAERAEHAATVRDARRTGPGGERVGGRLDPETGHSPWLMDLASDIDANRLHTFDPEMAAGGINRDAHRRFKTFAAAADNIRGCFRPAPVRVAPQNIREAQDAAVRAMLNNCGTR